MPQNEPNTPWTLQIQGESHNPRPCVCLRVSARICAQSTWLFNHLSVCMLSKGCMKPVPCKPRAFVCAHAHTHTSGVCRARVRVCACSRAHDTVVSMRACVCTRALTTIWRACVCDRARTKPCQATLLLTPDKKFRVSASSHGTSTKLSCAAVAGLVSSQVRPKCVTAFIRVCARLA